MSCLIGSVLFVRGSGVGIVRPGSAVPLSGSGDDCDSGWDIDARREGTGRAIMGPAREMTVHRRVVVVYLYAVNVDTWSESPD